MFANMFSSSSVVNRYPGIKFSEDLDDVVEEEAESDFERKRREEYERHEEIYHKMKVDDFNEGLDLPDNLREVIGQDEDVLLSMWVDQDKKNKRYEDEYEDLYDNGEGRKAGAVMRSFNTSYRKFTDRVDGLLVEHGIDSLVSSNFLRIEKYLHMRAIKEGLVEEEYYDGVLESTEEVDDVQE